MRTSVTAAAAISCSGMTLGCASGDVTGQVAVAGRPAAPLR